MPILYEMPSELLDQPAGARGADPRLVLPREIGASADVVVEKGGPVRRHPRIRTRRGRETGIQAVADLEGWRWPHTARRTILEDLIEGFRRGLKEAGLVDGQDLCDDLPQRPGRYRHAQALF